MKKLMLGLLSTTLLTSLSHAYEKPFVEFQKVDESKLLFSTNSQNLSVTSESAVISPAAIAPPLSQLDVVAVGSITCSWELLSQYDYRTSCNHGGPILRVIVREVGYGSNQIAYFNGGALPRSALYDSVAYCQGSSGLEKCRPGQSAVMFLNYYNLDGEESGYFEVQDTSSNPPIQTLRDSIDIW